MPLQADTKVAKQGDAYRYDEKSDFKGGLNLRADQFNIAYNESPAVLNVEVGFYLKIIKSIIMLHAFLGL